MNNLVDVALEYEGFPTIKYAGPKAGKTPEGFDCSGFVQWVLMESGISIPKISNDREIRHSEEFFDHFGYLIHPLAKQKGDLVFFSKNGARPSHIGIYLGDGKMIHSPGTNNKKVCIRSVDEYCKNRINFESGNGGVQIYFENPIGFKRVALPSENRYHEI